MCARLVSAVLGLWLMAAPAMLGYSGAAATSDRIVGPLVASIAVIAVWEVARGLRWIGLIAVGWLLFAPWMLGYELVAAVHSLLVGIALGVLTVMGGRRGQRFGGGWRAVFSRPVDRPLRR